MLWLLLLGMGRRGVGRGTREFSGDENVVYLDGVVMMQNYAFVGIHQTIQLKINMG